MAFDLTIFVRAEQEHDKNALSQKLKYALEEKGFEVRSLSLKKSGAFFEAAASVVAMGGGLADNRSSGGEPSCGSASEIDAGVSAGSTNLTLRLSKKSVDARHGQVKLLLRFKAFSCDEADALQTQQKIVWKKADLSENSKKAVIVGSGPAGLFAALKFLEYGIQPIIIERGKATAERKRDIALISRNGIVDCDSNYCFGEGGAGTFSDGKLYTRSDKRGDVGRVLRVFYEFGADEKILTDAHPHIGTDRLPRIINAMREKIISLGGEFYFGMRCADLLIEEVSGSADSAGVSGKPRAKKRIVGVRAIDLQSGASREFLGDAVFLATGHSAFDIYELLAQKCPECLEAKTFAMGVRVEHPRELIDKIQYHGSARLLGAAEYRFTSQIDGRGVYTFCMCPGGFVVPSATAPQEIVLNGMSSASRSSRWSNAAIVVETRPDDIPARFVEAAREAGAVPLAGLYYRRFLENETFLHGNGQSAPAQRLEDFLRGHNLDARELPPTSYAPGVVPSRLDEWLPPQIASRIRGGIHEFNKKMRGFVCADALLIASETRTSTPVRIVRDRRTFECLEIAGLYPCGEGSGYSGGIVSSAMDGENAAGVAVEFFARS